MAPHTNNVAEIEAQLQNWDNFCRYHVGDWHGIWTRYSSDGRSIDSFKCVRSFQLSQDGSQIAHQNYFTYPNGENKLDTFGPYAKPGTEVSMENYIRALFLDNSFSWGTTTVTDGARFGFETGFRHENRRMSAAVTYDEHTAELQRIVIISEQLENSPVPQAPGLIKPNGSWHGTEKTINLDLVTSSPEELSWQPLETVGGSNQIFRLPDGCSVSCPLSIKGNETMDLIVDWQAASTTLLRGTRHFDHSKFSHFLLQAHTS